MSTGNPVYRALYRPNLILGGEREPVLLLAVLCAGIAVLSLNIVAFAVCLFVWFAGIWALRAMAKVDPYMIGVYKRNLLYADFYPARSKPFRRNQKPLK